MTVLALIPARGGSRGIPRKNLLPVAGRPLLAWSVASALAARSVDRVVVSTDDEEIASVARAAGAEVPFLRPAALAGDEATDLPVFRHALEQLEAPGTGWRADLVVHLRPTSPARRPGLVDEAVARLRGDPEADAVRSVSPAPHTPYKMWRIEDRWLVPLLGSFDDELYNQPRQSLPAVWRHDGVVDVVRAATIRRGSMSGRRILPLALTREEAADLDEPADLREVEAALRHVGAAEGLAGGDPLRSRGLGPDQQGGPPP